MDEAWVKMDCQQFNLKHTLDDIKCIVIATRDQLESVGCGRDLTNCEVEYLRDYHTGYSQVKVERKDISDVLGKEVFEFYDIPKRWLKFNK